MITPKRITICNIPVDVLTMNDTLALIDNAIAERAQSIHHGALNAAKLVNALKNKELKDSITACNIINADGKAIVWASKLLGKPLPERVSGIDLMEKLVLGARKRGHKIFFLGAKEEVVTSVVQRYCADHGSAIIAGYRNGYFSKDEEPAIARQIAASGADILFVAITSPTKEIFLNTYKQIINVPFIMGVGGSFDVVSGLVKRAPMWMQDNGLEWLYRVLQEPARLWKRYLYTNTVFIYLVLREKVLSFGRPKKAELEMEFGTETE